MSAVPSKNISVNKLFLCDLGDVGVNSVVPVEEALCIDSVANLKAFNCLVNIGGIVAEIGLYSEGVCVSADRNLEVKVAVGIV